MPGNVHAPTHCADSLHRGLTVPWRLTWHPPDHWPGLLGVRTLGHGRRNKSARFTLRRELGRRTSPSPFVSLLVYGVLKMRAMLSNPNMRFAAALGASIGIGMPLFRGLTEHLGPIGGLVTFLPAIMP